MKLKLVEGNPPIGTFLVSGSRAVLEVLADAGFDFVIIDTEHFMLNRETIEQLVTAAEAAHITPFVRVPEDLSLIAESLDCGALGVIIPRVDTVEQAKKAVQDARFPPLGNRGVCNPRIVHFGAGGLKAMVQRFKEVDSEIFITAQIESKEAVDNLSEILAVRGLDSCFIGPFDLSQSLGVPGDIEDERVQTYIRKALDLGHKAGKKMGMMAFDPEESQRYIQTGFDYIVYRGDMMICLLYTSPSPRDQRGSRMPSSA